MRRCKVRHAVYVVALICGWPFMLPTKATGGSGEITPQVARIATAGAAVHSGPGDSYYLTDTLSDGETVEVYRRRDDDWCAIRPPSDSFSWVFASNLQLDDEGLAKVTKDGTASRVGSRLSSNRDIVQVRLRKGETVKVLGKDTQSGETWYKIAPPAGEFRWIPASSLTFEDSSRGSKAESGSVTRASHDEPIGTSQDAKSTEFMAPPLVSTAEASAPSPTTFTSPKPTPSLATQPVANPAAPASVAAASPPLVASPATPKQDVAPIVSPPAATPELAGQLRDLELRLSRMVAESPATWNTEALEQFAQQLLSKADTAADRDAVKNTLAKIDRFAAIQQRSVAANGGAVASTARGNISPSTVTPLPGVTPVGTGTTGQFDAVGVLRPVVSKRPGAPQFALVDERGQVVTFVTPTPDVNLQPYLGQRIGVIGSRGYIPEFHRAHVTAARIAPLGSTVLR